MSRRVAHGFDNVGFMGFPVGGGHRGVGSAVPTQTAPGGVGRHGSGARGSDPTGNSGFGGPMGLTPPASLSPRRQREEDDDGNSPRRLDRERDRERPGFRPRPHPASEPQDQIDEVMRRLTSIDAILRRHGQSLAVLEEKASILDVANAKQEEKRVDLDDRMQDGGRNIATRIQSMAENYDRKINELEQMVN